MLRSIISSVVYLYYTMMIMRRILFMCLVLVLFVNASVVVVEGIRMKNSLSKEEDLELERQLKILNKPPIKTIHGKLTGDIFDCVDIYKQPAFDNPLLKNHKIQLTPNFGVETTTVSEATPNAKYVRTELEIQGEQCPTGSVPIRRTKKEDLIRAKSIYKPKIQKENFYKPNAATNEETPRVTLRITTNIYGDPGIQHYGGKAFFNVYNPAVQSNSYTGAEMSLVRPDDNNEYNAIRVGWTVNPQLYGDNSTRLYTLWTAKEAGCYNLLCTGFVQTDQTVTLGVAFGPPVSVYGGAQYGVTLIVRQDLGNGNWWFLLGSENRRVGYWPKSLFFNLDSASYVSYGGVGWAPYKAPLPPMGNGHFPERSFTKSAYISQMKVVNANGSAIDFDIPKAGRSYSRSGLGSCYSLDFYKRLPDPMEIVLAYGGPGGYC